MYINEQITIDEKIPPVLSESMEKLDWLYAGNGNPCDWEPELDWLDVRARQYLTENRISAKTCERILARYGIGG